MSKEYIVDSDKNIEKRINEIDQDETKPKGEEYVFMNEKGEYTVYIKGKWIIRETGKLDMERLIRALLKTDYITGKKQ